MIDLKKLRKKRLDKKSSFLLIGNKIDGAIYSDKLIQFKSFNDLKSRIFVELNKIKATGEWDFTLYQVPADYRIFHKNGYYKYLDRGQLIYSYNYLKPKIFDFEFIERKKTGEIRIACLDTIQRAKNKKKKKYLMVEVVPLGFK